MLVYWCVIEGCILPLPTPRTAVLGYSVLDDEGLIRAWEVMRAQVGSGLVPTEGARTWIEGLPFATQLPNRRSSAGFLSEAVYS